jgi:hypothetical protein
MTVAGHSVCAYRLPDQGGFDRPALTASKSPGLGAVPLGPCFQRVQFSRPRLHIMPMTQWQKHRALRRRRRSSRARCRDADRRSTEAVRNTQSAPNIGRRPRKIAANLNLSSCARKSRRGFPRRLVPLRCVCGPTYCVERCSNARVHRLTFQAACNRRWCDRLQSIRAAAEFTNFGKKPGA